MDRASRRAVLERLTALDDMGAPTGTALPPPVARTHLRRIIEGWRHLLTGHQPDSRGRCPVCSGLLRRRKWPCQIWITAHQQLIGDARGEEQRVPAPRAPARPARDVEIVARGAGGVRGEPERPAAPTRAGSDPVLPAPLETENERIHRAAVIERSPTMPRARLIRRPRR